MNTCFLKDFFIKFLSIKLVNSENIQSESKGIVSWVKKKCRFYILEMHGHLLKVHVLNYNVEFKTYGVSNANYQTHLVIEISKYR